MDWMAASNPLKLARGWLGAKGEDRMADALFRMKAVDMAHDYQTLFGGLAQDFGVTVVAGSIVLPNPRSRRASSVPAPAASTTSARPSAAMAGRWASRSANSSPSTTRKASPAAAIPTSACRSWRPRPDAWAC